MKSNAIGRHNKQKLRKERSPLDIRIISEKEMIRNVKKY
jgi:hypothetical protein